MLSSDELFRIIFLDAPSAPTNLTRIKSTANLITITWSAPKETGHHPIKYYLVETGSSTSFDRGKNYTVINGRTKYEHTFRYLKPNTKYSVYVSAYNNLGRGAEATQTYETVTYGVPGW